MPSFTFLQERLAGGLIAFSLILLGTLTAQAKPLLLTNADIYTVNPNQPWADTMALDDEGMIIALGNKQEVLQSLNQPADIIDLEGRMIMPGFQDAHIHAVEAGMFEIMCLFAPIAKIKTYRKAITDCAEEWDKHEWILGGGINMANLLSRHDNPIEILDAIAPDQPILILDDLGHGAWVNSEALARAGWAEKKDNPPGGLILRHKKTGRPNGVVLEDAQQIFRTLAFPPTPDNVELAYESLLFALKKLAENGITSVSDAGGYWPQDHPLAWQRALDEGLLTVRASNALYVYSDADFETQIKALKKHYSNEPGSLLRFNQAKIYVDGILSQTTAALLSPYEGRLSFETETPQGFTYFEEAMLNKYASTLSEAGFQLHLHVTGDRGARLALNAIEKANPLAGPHRLTHLFLLDEADIGRFAELGAVADFQLAPSTVNKDYINYIKSLIGSRADAMMPAGAVHEAGGLVTLSSDWDADDLPPLLKIETAVTRKKNGAPDIATAIQWMTLNPARLLRHEEQTGSLEVGKAGDMVILGENIFEIPVAKISDVTIEATLLQGEAVYDPSKIFQ